MEVQEIEQPNTTAGRFFIGEDGDSCLVTAGKTPPKHAQNNCMHLIHPAPEKTSILLEQLSPPWAPGRT